MVGGYVLLNQLSAGRDGVRYKAFDPRTKSVVELRLLKDDAGDPLALRERSKRLKAAALLTHTTALRVLELVLEPGPAYVSLEWRELSDDEQNAGTPTIELPLTEAVARAIDLAAGIAEAHRIGLAGAPMRSVMFAGGQVNDLKIDWTDLDVGSPLDLGPDDRRLARFRAPELKNAGARPGPEADIYALAVLLRSSLDEGGATRQSRGFQRLSDEPALASLLREMLSDDPYARPTANRVVAVLEAIKQSHVARDVNETYDGWTSANAKPDAGSRGASQYDQDSSEWKSHFTFNLDSIHPPAARRLGSRERLGRFLLREKLGEGGMGTVFRGEDATDGSIVAIKVLRDQLVQRPDSLRRFYKEARLLAEINNPYVTNLVEINEDDGIHFIALEFMRGTSLTGWLQKQGRLDETTALAIVADVARGLAAAHERGIIHRDIKPDNILLVDEAPAACVSQSTGAPEKASAAKAPPRPRVKLSDFGLARHVLESESLHLTQTGAILGTPLYMSPEQGLGTDDVGPPADVYSMGATLFHLLAGEPPFSAETALGLIAMHRNEAPPSLKNINQSISEGVCQVVTKALAKRPGERYGDAGELLLDIERLLRGEPTGIQVHPMLPVCDPKKLVQFDFRWELDASPRQLWPYVSNTERVNRALGLPAVPFKTEYDPDEGTRRYGELTTAGLAVHWREFPYEWIEGRRMGVLRDFDSGPFKWFVSIVELTPRPGGGTILTHRVRIAVHGLLGRAVAALKIGNNGRKSMDQLYRRIDAALTGKLGADALVDPFEPPGNLPKDRQRRLDDWLASLEKKGIDPEVAERVGEFLAQGSAQEVARIRPLALARRLGLDPDQVVAICLRGAYDGVLVLLWDLLCPVCRIPSQVIDTLRALRDHAHCEACHLDFELDFANSVEMIFRVHPEVRETELGAYCIGGPAHSPHVVAQVRVSPGERISLDLTLGEGAYKLRGPQLPYSIDFRVEPSAPLRRWELDLSSPPDPALVRTLNIGGQTIALTNDTPRELVVRVERTAARDDALTAARASALALFRDLFPGEILSGGQLINLTTMTLLVTELDHSGDLYQELGDARAFALIHEHFRILDQSIRDHDGALIKTVNEGLVAVFTDSLKAVETAFALGPALALGDQTRDLRLRIGVHRGPAMVATLNDHLDYFGSTVNAATQLPRLANGGGVVLGPTVAADPAVADFLEDRGLIPSIVEAQVSGLAEGFVLRVSADRKAVPVLELAAVRP